MDWSQCPLHLARDKLQKLSLLGQFFKLKLAYDRALIQFVVKKEEVRKMYESQRQQELQVNKFSIKGIEFDLNDARDAHQVEIQDVYKTSQELLDEIKQVTYAHRQQKRSIAQLQTSQQDARSSTLF